MLSESHGQALIEVEQQLHAHLDVKATFARIPLQLLSVDKSVAFLTLLEEMHELALILRQVANHVLVSIAHWLAIVLGQPLVGVHNFETRHVSSKFSSLFC